MAAKRILVIGGSAAGPKAAAKARRMDQHAEITLIQKDPDLSMASCGYPYYVGGTFDDRNQLICTPTGVIRDPKFFLNAKGIAAHTLTEATHIDRHNHAVTVRDLQSGEERTLGYDKLVIATGAKPFVPPVPGADLEGITTLQSMADADYLRKVRDERKVRKAVIIGGGLIGMETCEALRLAGIEITVIEMLPQILKFLDWELAKRLEEYVKSQAALVVTENPVTEFLGAEGRLTGVKLKNGTELPCELAVVAVGVRPNAALAAEAGLELGALGGIRVDEHMRTSDPDIYAVGDCCEISNLITGQPTHMPMGDLANLQGRVVGQNVIQGDEVAFPGTLMTGVCKVFDWTAGSTGLSEAAAREAGMEVTSVVTAMPDKPGFMGANLLIMKMIAETGTGKLVGFQCIGPGDASKRIAAAAMALHGGLAVSDLLNADLPYAPPFSAAIDAFVTTAHVLEDKMFGRMKGISAPDFKRRLDAGEKMFLLDVRGPDEFEQMRLGLGETLIPLGALRSRLDDLPEDKTTEIITWCKISLRGYEAQSFLESQGYTNVKVLEGGIMAWPYPRER
jgi:NADPH-dependent 2,4-dienoyl-CoA reductase/sulfur reductase-like enzyme/rhodanese-related sulfurtransferase